MDLVSSLDADNSGAPVLQQSYSVVADELPRAAVQTASGAQGNSNYSTYAEIEECGKPASEKPKPPLVNKRSVDNSKRELPAKPDVVSSVYSEIGDSDTKDTKTEKGLLENKNKRNQEDNTVPDYIYKKKLSNASNIYAECEDVREVDGKEKEKDKTYMDMSHKRIEESEYVPHTKESKDSKPHTKYSKDKVNESKRSRVREKPTNQKAAEKVSKPDVEGKKKVTGKDIGKTAGTKKKSVTSESDSDDDIVVVENELYEPFESAKV